MCVSTVCLDRARMVTGFAMSNPYFDLSRLERDEKEQLRGVDQGQAVH